MKFISDYCTMVNHKAVNFSDINFFQEIISNCKYEIPVTIYIYNLEIYYLDLFQNLSLRLLFKIFFYLITTY